MNGAVPNDRSHRTGGTGCGAVVGSGNVPYGNLFRHRAGTPGQENGKAIKALHATGGL